MGNFIKKTYLKYALATRNAWFELKFNIKSSWNRAGEYLDEMGIDRVGGKKK